LSLAQARADLSFSADVKNELVRAVPERSCCRGAMLGAIILADGALEEREGRLHCAVQTSSNACVRLLLRLIKLLGNPPTTWEAQRSPRFGKTTAEYRYIVRVRIGVMGVSWRGGARKPAAQPAQGPSPLPWLARLGITPGEGDSWGGYEYSAVKKRCCKRAFLRGAFLAGGSVGHPARYYHLEWVARDAVLDEVLQQLLAEVELPARALQRTRHVARYLKASADIARALSLMGATQGLLKLEEVRAFKETKNQVRRRVNLETANLDRSSQASVRQVAAIRLLQERVGLRDLEPLVRTVARARLRWPEASYSELGRKLQPALDKVAICRHLQRLEKLAAGLRGTGTEQSGSLRP
jgi:DNA-binding transcriptional regulator WhiA